QEGVEEVVQLLHVEYGTLLNWQNCLTFKLACNNSSLNFLYSIGSLYLICILISNYGVIYHPK
ncbi:MAG: hypothetical protein WCR15_06395, partial [Arcobacteraceae bacterium]